MSLHFSFALFSLRDKPEKFTEDTESLRSTTPDDMRSVVSTTSTDAVIIEGKVCLILGVVGWCEGAG